MIGQIPFSESSTVSLARGARENVQFDKMRLKARRWLLIDEVKFCVNPKTQGTAVFSNDIDGYDLASIVTAVIKVGRHYIAGDPVPLWLFGSRWNLRSERSAQLLVTSTVGVNTQPWTNLSHITWKFLHPMLVSPDTVLGFTLQRPSTDVLLDPAAVLPNAFEVESTISGFQLLSAPRERGSTVPYVQSFVIPTSDTGKVGESGEYPLRNPFTKPLRIERLVARVAANDVPASVHGPLDFLTWPSFTAAANKTGKNTVLIQVYDNFKYDIANQPSFKWPSVFNPTYQFFDAIWQAQNSSLVCPFTLNPKGWLNVRFQRSDGNTWNQANFPASPMFAAIGSRQEMM